MPKVSTKKSPHAIKIFKYESINNKVKAGLKSGLNQDGWFNPFF